MGRQNSYNGNGAVDVAVTGTNNYRMSSPLSPLDINYKRDAMSILVSNFYAYIVADDYLYLYKSTHRRAFDAWIYKAISKIYPHSFRHSNEYAIGTDGYKLSRSIVDGTYYFMLDKVTACRMTVLRDYRAQFELSPQVSFIIMGVNIKLWRTRLINKLNAIFKMAENVDNKQDLLDYVTVSRSDRIYVTLPSKSYDEIFFDGKDELISLIEKWKGLKDIFTKYKARYKYTILLHGPSGTGKTSFAKAVAYARKCNLYHFESIETFVESVSRDVNVDAVYLLDELDLLLAEDKTLGVIKNTTDEKDNLRISKFLSAMDILSWGVILIATTNNLNKLDPSVYRKGRFDKVLEVKRADDGIAKQMIEYYNADPEDILPEVEKFIDEHGNVTYSQADIEGVILEKIIKSIEN